MISAEDNVASVRYRYNRKMARLPFGLRCMFASGFVVMASLVIFLSTQLYIIRSQLNNEINDLRDGYDVKYMDIKDTLDNELISLKTTLNNELGDVRNTLHSHNLQLALYGTMITELTTTVDERLNTTIHDLNVTVSEATNAVQGKVFTLTKDVGNYVNTTQDQFDDQTSMMAVQSAGTFTIIGSIISLWHMTSHARNFHEPIVQRKIMAILWMTPIYGITSFFSIFLTSLEGYLAVVKDFYEAYCIYTFLSFLIAVLGRGNRDAVVELISKHSEHLSSPMSFFGLCGKSSYATAKGKADALLLQWQMSTMQFVLIRPISSVLLLICNGAFGKVSIWNPGYPQFYITMIINVSVFVAFSGLLKFYHAVQDELAWCKPFPKFMCIKGVVFMTFWQSIVISIYVNTSSAFVGGSIEAIEWRFQTQNFLVCIEMFFFSVMHYFVFPTEEWVEGYKPKEKVKQKFGDQMALRDFVQDVKLIARSGKRKRRNKAAAKAGDSSAENLRSSNSPLEIGSALADTDQSNDYVDALLGLEDDDDLEFISNVLQTAESLKLDEECIQEGETYREVL